MFRSVSQTTGTTILMRSSYIYRIHDLGLRISQGLINLINEASGKNELAKRYDSQNAFFLEPVHGEDILEEAIEKLEPMFQRRIRAVEVEHFHF